jgi:DNA repair exonuclease SbcCD ATPase subunit
MNIDVGKSSLVDAIEWCLFGKLSSQAKNCGAKQLINKNAGSTTMYVSILLKNLLHRLEVSDIILRVCDSWNNLLYSCVLKRTFQHGKIIITLQKIDSELNNKYTTVCIMILMYICFFLENR